MMKWKISLVLILATLVLMPMMVSAEFSEIAVFEEVSSEPFKTGEMGYIKVVFRNPTGERGGYTVFAVCEPPFHQSGSNYQVTVGAGETYTLYIPITAGVSERTSKIATVYVCKLGERVSQPVVVTAEPQYIPTPTPTPTPTPSTSGFEAVFAIAGLLAVMYLMRREG